MAQHLVALSRIRIDEGTQAYIRRRLAEGLSNGLLRQYMPKGADLPLLSARRSPGNRRLVARDAMDGAWIPASREEIR